MFEFQNLAVYKKAKLLNGDLSRLLNNITPGRIISDQLSRASLSIVLNIAEGSGKFAKRDRRNFFVIARGSIFECVAILDILKDRKHIEETEFEEYLTTCDELSRILFAMIRNLEEKSA